MRIRYASTRGGGLFGQLIRLGTRSRWGHSVLQVELDTLGGMATTEVTLEGRPDGVGYVDPATYGTGLRWAPWYDVPGERATDLALWTLTVIRAKYDYRSIVDITLHLLGWKRHVQDDADAALICSGLAVRGFALAGWDLTGGRPAHTVTPGDLEDLDHPVPRLA